MPSVTNIVQPVIVQIVPQMNRGGVERGTVEIAEAISARGWKAVVICNGGRMENQLRRAGAEVYTLPVDTKNPLKWPAVRRRLAGPSRKGVGDDEQSRKARLRGLRS